MFKNKRNPKPNQTQKEKTMSTKSIDPKLPTLSSAEFNRFANIAYSELNTHTYSYDGDNTTLSEYDRGICVGLMKSKLAGLIPHATINDIDVIMVADTNTNWVDITFTYIKGNKVSWAANMEELGIDVT